MLRFLIKNRFYSTSNFLAKLYFDRNLLRNFGKKIEVQKTDETFGNLFVACEPEYLLPVLMFAQSMEFPYESNIIQNIQTYIGVHINDLGLADVARLHSRLVSYPDYRNSKLENIIYLRAAAMYQQMELTSAMSEENITGLSDFDNPTIIGMIMSVLRFPRDKKLLSTMESVFYNQAYLDRKNRVRHPRSNLYECLYLAEILFEDQRLNNRNLYLPEFYKNFRRSETGTDEKCRFYL